MTETADHVLANRASWDGDADNWVERGRVLWERDEPWWGIWHVPESTLGLLPDVEGLDAVELGCGTGYVSSWLARRGARPVGLDNSARQLATAARFQKEFGVVFPLVHGDASARRFATSRSTSRSRSTARRSGATRSDGSRRLRASFVREERWCSSATLRSRC